MAVCGLLEYFVDDGTEVYVESIFDTYNLIDDM